MDKAIFCSLAFGAVSLDSTKDYKPCCGVDTNHWEWIDHTGVDYVDSINSNNLTSIRKQLLNGQWPLTCHNCKKSEEAGADSMRTIWNRTYERTQTEKIAKKLDLVVNIDPKQIFYLDFTFSTKCNSKCLTCGPGASDFWEEEWEHIYGDTHRKFIPIDSNRVRIDETKIESIMPYLENVRYISFVGGEPTISDEHYRFITLLVEKGYSKNISLSYVTNLTGLSDELIETWKQFKGITVSVSIDGYGTVNEYIRYPFKWQKIEKNLRTISEMTRETNSSDTMLTKVNFVLSCTVSIFNAIYIPELLEFWYKILKEYDVGLVNVGSVFLNRLNHNYEHQCNLFSLEYRSKGLEKSNRLKNLINSELSQYPSIGSNLLNAITLYESMMNETQLFDPDREHIEMLKHFVTKSDEFRGRKVQDYLPDFAEELFRS